MFSCWALPSLSTFSSPSQQPAGVSLGSQSETVSRVCVAVPVVFISLLAMQTLCNLVSATILRLRIKLSLFTNNDEKDTSRVGFEYRASWITKHQPRSLYMLQSAELQGVVCSLLWNLVWLLKIEALQTSFKAVVVLHAVYFTNRLYSKGRNKIEKAWTLSSSAKQIIR